MSRSEKAEREEFRRELSGRGWTVSQIAKAMESRYRVRPRTAWRFALGWNQYQTAMKFNVATGSTIHPSRVSKWEGWPDPGSLKPSPMNLVELSMTFGNGCTAADLVDDVDRLHYLTQELLLIGDRQAPEPQSAVALVGPPAPVRSAHAFSNVGALLDPEVAEVEQQRAWLSSLHVDRPKLDYLAAAVQQIIGHVDLTPVPQLDLQARSLRPHLHQMLREPHRPTIVRDLYATCAYLSGVQATLALDLGRLDAGRAYAREAFDLAEATADIDLMAWARAGQSLVEYYDGQYQRALALADDGLDRSPRGVHAVRLSVNGRARALARMGDRDGVERAVDHGLTVMHEHAAPDVDLSASLDAGIYCEARTAGNAATAYLALRDADQVERYATLALKTFDQLGVRSTQAMTRLDIATVLLEPESQDVERATALVTEVLEITATERKYPVEKRTAEFLAAAQPWHALPAVREVRELVATRAQPRQIDRGDA